MKTWYVYRIEFSDGSFYIGYRGTKQVETDFLVKYFSSSKVVKTRIAQGDKPDGKVLAEFADQESALACEQELIHAHFSDPKILNRSCKFGVKGYGLLTVEAKKKISESSAARWADPEYRAALQRSQSEAWTQERKDAQVERLSGKKRPEHSAKMKGRTLDEAKKKAMRVPKPKDFGEKISAAMSGRAKTPSHIEKLKAPKPKVVCRIHDRKLMALGNFMNWLKKQS